jgi:hypothetical protein
MPTQHHKKTFAEKIRNDVHRLGEMLSIPTYAALDAHSPDSERVERHIPDHSPSVTMHKSAHTVGRFVSIPKQEAVDACAFDGNQRLHDADQFQQQKEHEQVGSGAHRMGEMLSIPIYEAIDACAHAPHQVHAAPHVSTKKSGNVQKLCRAVGAMLSVPIYEAAETCGSGPLRGH